MLEMGSGFRGWRALAGLVVVVFGLLAGRAEAGPVKLVQPFQVNFTRHDTQVIAFFEDHPAYDAVEVFYLVRPGQEPLIRAILTLLDGFQIEMVNDPVAAASIRSPFRPVFVRDILFEQTVLSGGRVHVTAQFVSFRAEDIVIDVTTISPPLPGPGALIDPGNHGETTSLPVLWPNDTAPGDEQSTVLINGVPQALDPGPAPGTVAAFYTAGFDLGVIAADIESLRLLSGPEQIEVGATWTFIESQKGSLVEYEVIALSGEDIVVRRTTGLEQIIVARPLLERPDLLAIRSIRATGLPAALNITPPPPFGLTLDLTVPGQFSVSLDTHADLITGEAEVSYDQNRVSWVLSPEQPDWAAPRTVYASGWFDATGGVHLLTTIGAPHPLGR
ncbi:MAG: hypothetical protein R3F14_30460 [Polyangiaceae bacterium]